MTNRSPLPRTLSNRAFTVAQASAVGIGRDRLRAADIGAPHHGIRAPAWVGDSVDERARQLLPALGAHQHFSHVTAASIWRMPLPTSLEGQRELDVTSVGRKYGMRRPGVRGHVTAEARRVLVRGLPVSDAAVTWVEMAEFVDVTRLVAIGDALVGSQLDLVRLGELRSAAAGHRARRRSVDQALELIRVGSESPKESEVRLLLPAALRTSAVLNVEVYAGARLVGRPDLAFVDSMVTIEYEGDHHRDRKTFQDDITRRRRFESAGWRVVQVAQRDLVEQQRADLAARVEALVHSREGLGRRLRREYDGARLIAVRG